MGKRRKQITVVTGCVIEAGKVLLTQRVEPDLPEADLKWELPGGKAELGESMPEVACREIREETGLDVRAVEQVPYVHTNTWHYPDRVVDVVVMCYICELQGDKASMRLQREEVGGARWIDIGTIDLSKVLRGIRYFLAWIAEHRFAVAISRAQGELIHYLFLEHADRARNMDRVYFASVGLGIQGRVLRGQLELFNALGTSGAGTGDPVGYIVTRSWGRRGQTPRTVLEEYFTESAAVGSLLRAMQRRRQHGYRVLESNMGRTMEEVVATLRDAQGS